MKLLQVVEFDATMLKKALSESKRGWHYQDSLPPGIPKRHEGAYTANLFLTPHSSYDVQNSAEFGFSLTGGCLWAE